MRDSLKIAIAGATGYTGLELTKILSIHPKVKIEYLCAQKSIGKKISFFDKSIKKIKLPKISKIEKIDWRKINVLFSALPNGEAQKIAKKIRWVAAGCILAIIGGAMSMKEDGWKESPYQISIVNEGNDNEIRYEMIPIGQTGTEIKFKLVELEKKYSGASFLIPLGIGVLIGDYLYDYIHGIRTIESKRDKVRFKYGKKLDFSFTPTYDLKNKTAGISFTYDF